MKATGIVRRIDDLGRVVIPKEIRRTMRIREGDPTLIRLTPQTLSACPLDVWTTWVCKLSAVPDLKFAASSPGSTPVRRMLSTSAFSSTSMWSS